MNRHATPLNPALAAVCAYAVLSLALITWIEWRWSQIVTETSTPLTLVYEVRQHLTKAAVHSERVEHGEGISSRDLVLAELHSAFGLGRQLQTAQASPVTGRDDAWTAALSSFQHALEMMQGSFENDETRKDDADFELRTAESRLEQAVLQVELALLERQATLFRQQDQLTALMLLLVSLLGVALLVHLAHAQRQREQALDGMRLNAAALQATQDGVMVTDLLGHIVSTNRAFTEITGYTEAEVIGQTPRLLQSGRHGPEFYQSLWQALREHGRWHGETWNRHKNGQCFVQQISISCVPGPDGQPAHYVAVFTEITEQKLAQERLQHMAHHDALTRLPNRVLVLEKLGQALASAQRQQHRAAVLFIDLDNFKTVNDSLGHAAGDALLEMVAERLARRTRREDTLGRLGGDEFILLLEHLHEPPEAAGVAQELLQMLQAPFQIGAGHEVYVQASIGISIFPDDGSDAGDLVRDADAAMYQAKRAGRNTYRYYTEALTQAAHARLALDTRLRRAIENGEFALFYQPLIDVASRQLIGLEALVRLNQPGLPPVGPAEFVPLLEENGQIIALGEWVTREACRQGQAWLAEGLDFGRIAINLSPAEVRRGGTIERIRAALAASGLPPERLELEITESGLMEHSEQAEALIAELHQLGVQLAIDDFGTGYSSLAYLKRFAVDKLKIDRSFIRGLGDGAAPNGSSSDAQLVRTMVMLGQNLGMLVLAEGVETEDELDMLGELGCQAAQGYLFSPPRPADEVRRWLKRVGTAPDTDQVSEALLVHTP